MTIIGTLYQLRELFNLTLMIRIENLTKIFHSKQSNVIALNKIKLEIPTGEFLLIKGPSGCGKSTLLFTLGGMLKPSSGKVIVDGNDLYALPTKELLQYRSRLMGFVYQSYHLIPYLNIMDNILLVNQVGKPVTSREEITRLAQQFNLVDRLTHLPAELSVGEKQRAALMRALVCKPKLLIADEPTGNLDPANSVVIMQHFKQFQLQGGTVIMASHNNDADELATREIRMEQGEMFE